MIGETKLPITWRQGTEPGTLDISHLLEETDRGTLLRRFHVIKLVVDYRGFITGGVVEEEGRVFVKEDGEERPLGKVLHTREAIVIAPPIDLQFASEAAEDEHRGQAGLLPIRRRARCMTFDEVWKTKW